MLIILISKPPSVLDILLMLPSGIDALDAKLIQAMCETPRAGVMELARQLGVARGTVQARLDKLQKRGIISGFDPDLDLQAMGYEVLAFVTLEIAQGRLDDVIEHLVTIPEVLEAHATTGPGDLHCRVVARTNVHLQAVLGRVLEVPGIMRTTTQIALSEQVRHRVLPLVAQVIDEASEAAPSRRKRGAR
jgi:DNA-binding Lrp family transcriptional regulator